MLIEIRKLQSFLQGDAKAVNQLVVPLLFFLDLFSYFSFCPIKVAHCPGLSNPADALTKPSSPLYIHSLMSDLGSLSYVEVDFDYANTAIILP